MNSRLEIVLYHLASYTVPLILGKSIWKLLRVLQLKDCYYEGRTERTNGVNLAKTSTSLQDIFHGKRFEH